MDEIKQQNETSTEKEEVVIYIPKPVIALVIGVLVVGMVLLIIYVKNKGCHSPFQGLFGPQSTETMSCLFMNR